MTRTFGQLLRQTRLLQGIGQREVARVLGVSGGTLCNIEHGHKRASAAMVRRLYAYFYAGVRAPMLWRRWQQAGARAHGWDV